MDPRQHDMGGHGADDMGVVPDPRRPGVGAPAVGPGDGAQGRGGSDEGMQVAGRIVPDMGEADAARPLADDLDGASDQQFSLVAAPRAPGQRVASYVRKLVTELSGGVFGYLDSVLERHSFDEFGELI